MWPSIKLRSVEVSHSQILALLNRLQLYNTQRQAIEKIVASEKFDAEKTREFVLIFTKKLEKEDLSKSKEAKDFHFWIEKMLKMIEIFNILNDESQTYHEDILDSFAIFPKSEGENVKAIFEFRKQLSEATVSKVRFFEEESGSKTLYDFTRSFIEENGSFKLHTGIRTGCDNVMNFYLSTGGCFMDITIPGKNRKKFGIRKHPRFRDRDHLWLQPTLSSKTSV